MSQHVEMVHLGPANQITAWKVGNVVTVAANYTLGGPTIATGGTGLGTLPEGFRPPYYVVGAASGKADNIGQIQINESGTVTGWLFGYSSGYFCATLTYAVC